MSRVEAASTPATRYDVVTAVWGEEFVTLFLDFCIPNQLAPGNLAALPSGSRYRIFTTAADAQQLGDSARNPVYVFDVSPSKDEFTRAPRGLFFRPVGIGRGVNAGQALAR